MKEFRTGILLVTILLASFVLVPATSAAAEDASVNNLSDSEVETYGIDGLTPQQIKEIEAEISRIRDMPDIVNNCPYMPLLVATDEQKEIFLGYIDNLSVSDSEKKEMKKELKDIWSRVPDKITEKDYPVMEKIGKAITTHVEETYWAEDQSVRWMSYAHRNLISAGVNLVYGNPTWAGWAYDTAMDPDTSIDTGSIYVPVPTPLGFVTISLPKKCYYHYYNPDLSFGGAPGKCSSYAAQAKTYYGNQEYQNAFETLGIASHYLSDVAQPMHSGGELGSLVDYLLNWDVTYHIRYEQYVNNNWNTGRNFGRWVTRNTNVNTVTDPAEAVRSMAAYSNPYSSLLWDEIYAHPDFDVPGQDTTYIQYVTIIMNQEAAKYNAGLAEYISS